MSQSAMWQPNDEQWPMSLFVIAVYFWQHGEYPLSHVCPNPLRWDTGQQWTDTGDIEPRWAKDVVQTCNEDNDNMTTTWHDDDLTARCNDDAGRRWCVATTTCDDDVTRTPGWGNNDTRQRHMPHQWWRRPGTTCSLQHPLPLNIPLPSCISLPLNIPLPSYIPLPLNIPLPFKSFLVKCILCSFQYTSISYVHIWIS